MYSFSIRYLRKLWDNLYFCAIKQNAYDPQ